MFPAPAHQWLCYPHRWWEPCAKSICSLSMMHLTHRPAGHEQEVTAGLATLPIKTIIVITNKTSSSLESAVGSAV